MPVLFQNTGCARRPPIPRQMSTEGFTSSGTGWPLAKNSWMSGSCGTSTGTVRPEASTRHSSTVHSSVPSVPMAATAEPSSASRNRRRATPLSRKGSARNTITSRLSPASSQNSLCPSSSNCCLSSSSRPSAVFSKMLVGRAPNASRAVSALSCARPADGLSSMSISRQKKTRITPPCRDTVPARQKFYTAFPVLCPSLRAVFPGAYQESLLPNSVATLT